MPPSRKDPLLAASLAAAVAVAALSVQPSRAAGRVFYVAPTGSDANDGSLARPFRQIRRALQGAGAGDRVLVRDGAYQGFDLRGFRGAPGSPLLIRALGKSAVIEPTTDRVDNRDTIHVADSSYVILDGLRSFNAGRAAVRVNASDHVTVRNGVFGNNARWGIFTNHSDDLQLINNECYGSAAEHGIYLSNSGDRPVVRGNHLHHNAACGLHMNADWSQGGDGIISGAVVDANVIHHNGAHGGSGINMDGVQHSLVRNNLLFGNLATGIAAFRIDGAQGPVGLRIFNNTVDQPANGRWALLFAQTAGRSQVRNNILLHAASYRGGLLHGAPTDVPNVDSDYNVLDRISPDDGGTVRTLAQWKTGMRRELHSLSASRTLLFVSPGADYHLRAAAPARDRGAALSGVPADLDGQRRPQGPAFDIGCDEVLAAP